MKIPIEQIIEDFLDNKAASQFAEYPSNVEALRETLTKWLTFTYEEDVDLVSYIYDEFCIIVVIREVDERADARYNLYRFFSVGERWLCSVDQEGLEPEEMIHYLTQKYKLI